MIGRLSGTVLEKSADGALIDVGGVGYEVALPLSTLAGLPARGQTAALSIHTYVREDDIKLFGFASDQDRTAFRTMLKVGGVGPKLALAVLGGLSGGDLARVIGEGDTRRLTAIPGIGKKTAERMILELGGKLTVNGASSGSPAGVLGELGSALKNLGFKAAQVDRVLERLRGDGEDEDGRPFEALLRRALALLKEK